MIVREDDKSWFTWPTLMVLMYHLGDETLKKTAFSPGQLAGTKVNVLHLAVRCTAQERAHAHVTLHYAVPCSL